MISQTEVERLTSVYQGYAASDDVRARWDARNPGNRAMLHERSLSSLRLLRAHHLLPLAGRRILEVGCGSGAVLAGLIRAGARPGDLYGTDLLPARIMSAAHSYQEISFHVSNAEALPLSDAQFDLVLLFTVFSSILDAAMARHVAAEVRRILKIGGAVLWYDFRYNNPRNPSVQGVSRKRICELFPNFKHHLHTITLLPPLARQLGSLTPLAYPLLAHVTLLRTHYLGLLVKEI